MLVSISRTLQLQSIWQILQCWRAPKKILSSALDSQNACPWQLLVYSIAALRQMAAYLHAYCCAWPLLWVSL